MNYPRNSRESNVMFCIKTFFFLVKLSHGLVNHNLDALLAFLVRGGWGRVSRLKVDVKKYKECF